MISKLTDRPTLIQPFRPPWWLRNAHIQTILGGKYLRPQYDNISFRRHRLYTPDDDFIDVDFADVEGRTWQELGESAPIVLILPGLASSARVPEVREAYDELARYGIRSLGMNYRACSGEINRTARTYHAGAIDDVQLVVDWIQAAYSGVPLGFLGISLGGALLLNFLGKERPNASAAAVISNPFDLSQSFHFFSRSFYNRIFISKQKALIQQKLHQVNDLLDIDQVMAANTMCEFDEVCTAPLHGFASAEAYYQEWSPIRFLSHIETPTLVIRSVDDPFLDPDDIPYAMLDANPNIFSGITQWGGHVGFLEKIFPNTWWVQRQVAKFMQEHLS